MEHTSCTEDRIQHALDRCLDGLRQSPTAAHRWDVLMCSVGQSMNRWSLEELVKRNPDNSIILLRQILRKTKEVQERCQYELVAPLAVTFASTLLQTPYCPPDTELLERAMEAFRGFLTWPEPYCSLCRNLLSTLQLEIKAPGISFQRLVREEQDLNTSCQSSKTMTVLLMNPSEVPADFLSVAEQLSCVQHSEKDAYVTLIKHAFQSTLGTKYPLCKIHSTLQAKDVEELREMFSMVSGVLETAAAMSDPLKGRGHVIQELEGLRERLSLPASNGRKCDGKLQTFPIPTAKCQMFQWEKDNFDVLNTLLEDEPQDLSTSEHPKEDEDKVDIEDDEGHDTLSVVSESYAPSFNSGADSDFFEDSDDSVSSPKPAKSPARLSQHLYRLLRKPRSLNRTKSLGYTESKDFSVVREIRSNSLPHHVQLRSPEPSSSQALQNQTVRQVCFRRRPILSCDEDDKSATLRVVVFGADHVAGKVARAYSSLRQKENACPRLSRAFKMQFYFVPVKRDSAAGQACLTSPSPKGINDVVSPNGAEDSTNDIAHLLGMLDPWYERNTLSLLKLPASIVCQQTSKTETESYDSSYEQRLPILADLVLYYCRFAARPALIQLYQAELTFASGERRTEVFVHSLELGHTAGTRAIKAMGTASKRFGIDGDREAVPLTLEIMYNRVVISGRSQCKKESKMCTSVNLTKACKNPEELDSQLECLQLSMTEVLKRQNGKSKKSYNMQLSLTEVKVDKVQVSGAADTTFAVCLDQDEKKVLQSVIRCDVSVCSKPDSASDWRRRRAEMSAQIQPQHPTFCSLLCLPIVTFSGALP
ncbi:phosphoinositide 3-kinase regulatory subunit 5 [Phycodurus eques]|uniref:phosphoinositide 3-kinase regulatory subunit 5 n=1 Tax=Phycodurus eques TaxID=693459 RepID=UPI002ACEFE41|nr:phosphoinositide 3-kinase regulatory subunit 5 [Phycodurus eques]XP_061534621.1 phosphoinositide 3-kinase regulatory subunit 5 [Phycodurus eques]XP_061534622.1 phosphoinositide 3-kinase regulatory subunit 5 [Phycodurus eques]